MLPTGTDCFLWIVLVADYSAIPAETGRGQHWWLVARDAEPGMDSVLEQLDWVERGQLWDGPISTWDSAYVTSSKSFKLSELHLSRDEMRELIFTQW